jgi:hypothetical protein
MSAVQVLTNPQMREEYLLEIFPNNYNQGLPHNEDQQKQFPKHVHRSSRMTSPLLNVYPSIKGQVVQQLRPENKFTCYHPTSRTPIGGDIFQ